MRVQTKESKNAKTMAKINHTGRKEDILAETKPYWITGFNCP